MEQLKQSFAVKLIAWIMAVVCGIVFAASVCGAYLISEYGFYTKTLNECREEKFEQISGIYSALALKNLQTENNKTYFADKNFKYGIIQASDYEQLKKMDLNKEETYVERNFTDEVSLENLNLFECNLNKKTKIYVDSSFFGYYYISNSSVNYISKTVNGCIYDSASGIFYFETEDGLYYPVQTICVQMPMETDGIESSQTFFYEYVPQKSAYKKTNGAVKEDTAKLFLTINAVETEQQTDAVSEQSFFEQDIVTFVQMDKNLLADLPNWKAEIYYPGESEAADEEVIGEWRTESFLDREMAYDSSNEQTTAYAVLAITDGVKKAEKLTVKDLSSVKDCVKNKIEYDLFESGDIFVLQGEDAGTNYYVVSYVPEKLVQKEGVGIFGSDLYVQNEFVFSIAETMKYSVYAVMAVSFLLFAGSIVYLIAAAGHRKGQTTITPTFLTKLPLDIFAVFVFGAELMCVLFATEFLAAGASAMDRFVFCAAASLFFLICGGVCALLFLLDLAVRVKLGILWKNTIIYRSFHFVKCGILLILKNLSILWQGILIFFAANFFEVFVFCMTGVNYGSIVIVWFLEKAVILFAIILLLIQMKQLLDAEKRIADGKLECEVDTKKMIPLLREYGEILNRINEGVSYAVNEKIKSERFKTELITNVSHDIKTPLTSIINYVDLLEKEDIENENAKEYLEVLKRQSDRLKKLIEDLIEASKASSGSLSVNLEKLEAGVFLVQTVGEFEEKTMQSGLELNITKPKEPIYIMADGRHFWRVIDNLMNNICKYAQPNTRVYINLEKIDTKVRIIFRNTSRLALNISSEELMERFVRGDSSRNTEGNGLGLSIAQSLMELMNGTLSLFVDGDLFKVVLEFSLAEKDN